MVVWNSMLLKNYYHILVCCEATCSFPIRFFRTFEA
jgi:hypothetical protein